MTFSAPAFLFAFLPLTLLLVYLADRRLRPAVALCASALFYAAGGLANLLVVAAVIALNYGLGIWLEARRRAAAAGSWPITAAVLANLAVLVFYKAFATPNFLPGRIEGLLFPLGLSYIIFQTISYVVDVHQETCDSERSLLRFALYVLLFPKIVSGPITPYHSLREQLANPQVDSRSAAAGLRRFMAGFIKKVLVADQLAQIADPVFALSSPTLPPWMLWLALLAFTIQLYFDFSGITDMALGLGQALGFRFVENFNYPYTAKSLTDFWRRWHISLINWFRQYVFLPLEFNRRRHKFLRQQSHIFLVFLLTGLWHGLTLNYLAWGALNGLVLALEMSPPGKWLKALWAPLQRLYTLALVMLGFIIFRSTSLAFAGEYLLGLAGLLPPRADIPASALLPLPFVPPLAVLALAAGLLFSLPVYPLAQKAAGRAALRFPALALVIPLGRDLLLAALFILAIAASVSMAFRGTIYEAF